MTLDSLLADMNSRGIALHAVGTRLKVQAPRGAVTPELLRLLETHKREIIQRLSAGPACDRPRAAVRADAWPSRFSLPEERYGCQTARLYPLIGHRVRTVNGNGRLLQVFSDRAMVLLDAEQVKPQAEQRATFVPPEEVYGWALM